MQGGFSKLRPLHWSAKIVQWSKSLAKWLVGIAAIAALSLALLPTILSMGPGLGAGTALANRLLPGIIQIQKVVPLDSFASASLVIISAQQRDNYEEVRLYIQYICYVCQGL